MANIAEVAYNLGMGVTKLCPRCQGYVAGDHWEIAPYACWNCGERYTEALEPVRRPPTALEMSRKYRQSYEASQSRR